MTIAATCLTLFVFLVSLDFSESQQWRGNYMVVRQSSTYRARYCACWYWWWGCSQWRWYWRTDYWNAYQCQPGWTDNADRNCVIPVCRPTCANGGTCVYPNDCSCPSWSSGRYTGCADLTCSYRRPCYPGNCQGGNTCTCEPGFISRNETDGCIVFNPSHTELMPVTGKSNVTLSNIRRTDNRTDFMFILEGTNTTSAQLEIIWSNQKRFNNLRFEYETYFTQPANLPERPNYVSNAVLGIIGSTIEVNVSKVARSGSRIRDPGSFKRYRCEGGFSQDNPALQLATCVVNDDQFVTLIEHGNWMNVKFRSKSGGFQKLINIDQQGAPYGTKYYVGLQDTKEVQFNFDFIAPKHCSEAGSWGTCTPDANILSVKEEFTKNPIKLYWKDWTDDMSGVLEYYVEVFKLEPDPFGRLIEKYPLTPVFSINPLHSSNIVYPEYRPQNPGMYSVLMETRDIANNSRIARRFVLYDDRSQITLNETAGNQLYIRSAVEETGYKWQTTTAEDVTINVAWPNHFANKLHEENKFLNSIEPYPTQFKEIQDDGVLYSMKYVANDLDDCEGKRTRSAISNYHGIVKFEIAKDYTLSLDEPTQWETVNPFSENTSFQTKLYNGGRVRVWIRATDILGNTKTDNTVVRVDSTPPIITQPGFSGHRFQPNADNGTFNYTSKLFFITSDQQSGVYKLQYTITIKTPGKPDRDVYTGSAPALTNKDTDDPRCLVVDKTCFIPSQELDLDNCWFMTMKNELNISTAVVTVTAYNQALLSSETTFEVGLINKLKGLEKYDGPQIRIESPSPTGFRIAWDIPEATSCFERAEIVLALQRKSASSKIQLQTYNIPGTSKFFDILGLTPETEYEINFGMKTSNHSVLQTETSLAVKTKQTEQASGTNTGDIAGVAVEVIAIVILVAVALIVLIQRGFIRPPERAQQISRAVSRRVRQTVYGEAYVGQLKTLTKKSTHLNEDMYIYGEIDLGSSQDWHLNRSDVTLETLLKSGHFANIYKARVRGRKNGEVVVAKTLKEGYSTKDEYAMKAKINFAGSKIGDHPNVLSFIGTVVNDDAIGPMIIYEYCEHGPLKDYLVANKTNVTLELQDRLFRFGFDIVKGMVYLASKQIVHRRLAARNILLTFVDEVKIAGFGPQPDEEDGGDAEQGKKERIPIKWMAPECVSSTKNATEKSDVWSFGVTLWEIFSLGDIPYTGKGRDLPSRLKKGERLLKPELCDDTWYAVMQKCWMYEPKKRPSFAEIRNELDNMFVAASGDDYYYRPINWVYKALSMSVNAYVTVPIHIGCFFAKFAISAVSLLRKRLFFVNNNEWRAYIEDSRRKCYRYKGYTKDDEFAMKAKINFSGSKVGDHPNILKFIGAVINDEALGPFIIYEYCEHGPLKDYLVENKKNVTLQLQEHLFRFGLDIAKGMEYLASKQIVHRRLAALNILLTFLNEVKIAGFGIQPDEEDGGDAEQGKKERIPIKWMAPECMSSTKKATEKSDVWSYAVVLWEIFSLGESPYTGKGRDLPSRIKKGERLPKPEQCDDTWYAVMQKCWMYEPKKRPTFAEIRNQLDNMFVAAPGDDYYYKR